MIIKAWEIMWRDKEAIKVKNTTNPAVFTTYNDYDIIINKRNDPTDTLQQ